MDLKTKIHTTVDLLHEQRINRLTFFSPLNPLVSDHLERTRKQNKKLGILILIPW